MKCVLFILLAIISNGEGQETRKEYSETENRFMVLEHALLALDSRLTASEEDNDALRVQLGLQEGNVLHDFM